MKINWNSYPKYCTRLPNEDIGCLYLVYDSIIHMGFYIKDDGFYIRHGNQNVKVMTESVAMWANADTNEIMEEIQDEPKGK